MHNFSPSAALILCLVAQTLNKPYIDFYLFLRVLGKRNRDESCDTLQEASDRAHFNFYRLAVIRDIDCSVQAIRSSQGPDSYKCNLENISLTR